MGNGRFTENRGGNHGGRIFAEHGEAFLAADVHADGAAVIFNDRIEFLNDIYFVAACGKV